MPRRTVKKDVAAAIDASFDEFHEHQSRCRSCYGGSVCKKGRRLLNEGALEAKRRLGPVMVMRRHLA